MIKVLVVLAFLSTQQLLAANCMRHISPSSNLTWQKQCHLVIQDDLKNISSIDLCLGEIINKQNKKAIVVNGNIENPNQNYPKAVISTASKYNLNNEYISFDQKYYSPELLKFSQTILNYDRVTQELSLKLKEGFWKLKTKYSFTAKCID